MAAVTRTRRSVPKHRQVHISHGEQEADVDEGIAPLVLATWGASIATSYSCEDAGPAGLGRKDGAGLMFIGFPTAAGAVRWFSIVLVRDKAEPNKRLFWPWAALKKKRWTLEVAPYLKRGGGADLNVRVYFRRDAMAAIIARLRRASRPRRPAAVRDDIAVPKRHGKLAAARAAAGASFVR
jgi:hypothetical protein